VDTQIVEQQAVQPDTAAKAPWQTPTLTDFSIEKVTAIGGGTGADNTAGPNAS
jgi:hypothetical protein